MLLLLLLIGEQKLLSTTVMKNMHSYEEIFISLWLWPPWLLVDSGLEFMLIFRAFE